MNLIDAGAERVQRSGMKKRGLYHEVLREARKKKRTIIDLPDEDLKRLDALAEEDSVPRASVLREAVAEYVVRKGKAPATPKPLAGFGALKGYYGDAQSYQDELRGEWE